ncbi:MAG: barstar family protein [Novosphingobium sp.]|nr:barstar family protein [Novosphingobium sp.]
MDERKRLVIEGGRITGIPSFYDEINRVFMAGENWKLGESLDALDDLLHGGYGTVQGIGAVTLVWRDMAASRSALGAETTCRFLEERQKLRPMFNGSPIAEQLVALAAGRGTTYFDIVMDIFAAHPAFTIVPA